MNEGFEDVDPKVKIDYHWSIEAFDCFSSNKNSPKIVLTEKRFHEKRFGRDEAIDG